MQNNMVKRVYKSRKEKQLFGVCGGLAEYFECDPSLIRLATVLLALCFGGGLFAYLIAAIVIPYEPAPETEQK